MSILADGKLFLQDLNTGNDTIMSPRTSNLKNKILLYGGLGSRVSSLKNDLINDERIRFENNSIFLPSFNYKFSKFSLNV